MRDRLKTRVTGVRTVRERTRYYLCGRNEIVYAVFRRLRRRGVSGADILTEVYF